MHDQDKSFRKRLALELLVQGEHKAEVAELIGVSVTTVGAWGREHGIRVRSRNRKSPVRRRCEELILQGWRDAEVARAIGVNWSSVRRWRIEAGVPVPPRVGTRGPRALRAEELLRLGWHDADVAREVGVTRQAIRQWRARAGIPPLPHGNVHPLRDEVDALVLQGVPDEEIARRLGVARPLVRGRRSALGLMPRGRIREDLGGRRFGRLTAIEVDREKTAGPVMWRCLCSCGKSLSLRRTALVSGATRSCGCLRREVVRQKRSTHGALLLERGEADVAREVGVPRELVAKWREATQAPAPRHEGKGKGPRREMGEELIRLGWRDRDVARELGVTRQAVRYWRKAEGIAQLPFEKRRKSERRVRGEELIRLGWADWDVAGAVGVCRETVRLWRVEMGVPPLPQEGKPHPRRDEIDALLRQDLTSVEIARRTQASESTIHHRRRQLGLPLKGQWKDDLAGRVFGRLTAIEIDRDYAGKQARWRCLCTCGRIRLVLRNRLLTGYVKSCGCLQAEVQQRFANRRRKRRPAGPESRPAP